MAIWSSLRSSLGKLTGTISKKGVRFMSGGHDDHHRVMAITPSRFQWKKTKDLIHFYAMIGLIPIGILLFYVNVYIGPAKLAPIPDDYVPQHWEYHKHPVTRFLARYCFPPPQQDYEKLLHELYEEDEKKKIRLLQKRVMDLMGERHDYQAFYYYPVDGKYYRIVRQEAEDMAEMGGFLPPVEGPQK